MQGHLVYFQRQAFSKGKRDLGALRQRGKEPRRLLHPLESCPRGRAVRCGQAPLQAMAAACGPLCNAE